MRKKSNIPGFSVAEQSYYMVELARGASHIASCITINTTHVAINEVSAEFICRHGKQAHSQFLEELARKLEEKDRPDAAASVTQLLADGVLPCPEVSRPAGSRAHKARKVSGDTVRAGGCSSSNDSLRQELAA